MLGVAAAAIALVVCSAVVGQGLCALCGRPQWNWWAPGVGFAGLVMLGGVLIRAPGHAKAVAFGVALATVLAFALPSVRAALRTALPEGLPIVAITLLASLIPFLIWKRVGLLGEGVNNDSGAHLGTAWWLQHQRGPVPVGALGGGLALVGYPVGPHGLLDVLALARISLEHAFNGLVIAIAPLTALAALGGIPARRRLVRVVAAVLVGLTYMAVSFEVQGSFKETIEALLVLTTALSVRDVLREPASAGLARSGVPAGVAIAGSVYAYSYGGLVWTVATAGAVWLVSGRLRASLPAVGGALAACALVVAPALEEFTKFADSPFNHEIGDGNLVHPLSVFEALGIWFNYDFRWTPSPLWPTAIGVAVAVAAALVALVRLIRAHEIALPISIVPVLGIYAYATANKSIYLSAKALAVASPLVATTVAAGLLWPLATRVGYRRIALRALTAAAAIGVAASSFMVLREARVGPLVHRAEIEAMKPHIKDGKVLFMPKDDLIQWNLIGYAVWQGRPFYAPLVVPYRPARARAEFGFEDFDNFTPRVLDQFRYAITSNTPYQSTPPPNWRPAMKTRSFILWKRRGPTHNRYATDFPNSPGRIFDCNSDLGRARIREAGKRGYAWVLPTPVVGHPINWNGEPWNAGQSATMRLQVPRGRWDVSLAYASNPGLRVSVGGLSADMPATIDRLGPYYYVGTFVQRRSGEVTVRVTANKLGLLGRLLDAHGRTRALDSPSNVPLGGVALTRHGEHGRKVAPRKACGLYVDHVVPRS